ncbi:helix-turn-helix transcriptional regulator [Kribbella sp. NPDC056345]|uniref:helix-turn-helix transcriptional regulator n=1 Tax=Kribbella sp. NPDC056345 TaxID=3345789 RepID=UPI0035E2D58B
MSGDDLFAPARQPVVSPLYVGRRTELAELRTAADLVEAGGSARILIAGEAGIGKSRLVTEFAATLGADWLTVTGACPELGAEHLPYIGFLPVVQQLVQAEGGSASGSPLRTLLSQQDAQNSRLTLLQELLALVERAATKRPLLLVVEDLHWADGASRELFGYLARNLGRLPVLLVGTVRTGELPAGHPIRQLVAELGRRADVTTLELGPLRQRDVGEQLTALDGRYDPARAAAIHRRSGGNPLFVEALAHDAPGSARSGTAQLRTLLQERVARLSESARPVLAVASIAGATVGHELLTLLVGRTDDELDLALRELVERDQLQTTATGYQFRHALIREAVYTGLLPAERRRLHGRAAKALSEFPALAAQGLPAAELAEHWYLAGHTEEAYQASLIAADEARASFAYTEELRHLERALSLRPADDPDRLTLLERAMTAAIPAGAANQGLQHTMAAWELVDPEREPGRAAEILLIRAQFKSRRDLTGRADLDHALELLPTDRPSYALGVVHYLLSIDEATARRGPSAHRHAAVVAELAETLDDDRLRCRAFAALGDALCMSGDPDAAVLAQLQAQELATTIGDDYVLVASVLWECAALGVGARYEELARRVPSALRQAELVGMHHWRGPLLRANLVMAYFALGRWDEAVETIEQALAGEPEPLYRMFLRAELAEISIHRGNFEQAAEVLITADEVFAGAATYRNYILGYVTSLWCELAMARQEPEAANREVGLYLQHCRDHFAGLQPDDGGLMTIARLQRARLAAAPRNREIAADVASIRATVAGLLRLNPHSSRLSEATRQTTEAALGPAQIADWDKAADRWRQLGHLPWTAECLISAAETALATSNRAGARRRLEEARDLATVYGGTVALDRIAVLGQRARLEPPTTTPEDNTGLTPREYDVLRLLARGLPNRQIAAELYISPATVGVHVGRILTKLNATTRTEATAVAHSRGLLTPD